MGVLALAWSKIRNVTSGRLLGRITSGTGRAEELTPAQVRSLCSVYSTSEVDAIAAAKVSAASLAIGTSGSDLNWSGTTLHIPDAGSSARGVVTTGAQTIAGAKTFTGGTTITGGGVSGTYGLTIGSHSVGIGGIWSDQLTPSAINYTFAIDQTHTYINAPNAAGSIYFRAGGNSFGTMSSILCSLPSLNTGAINCQGINVAYGGSGGTISTTTVPLVLNPATNVGIGISPTAGRLHVKQTASAYNSGLAIAAVANDSFLSLRYDGSDVFIIEPTWESTGAWKPLAIRSGGTTRILFGVDGNIGIGTNGAAPLHVYRSGSTTSLIESGANFAEVSLSSASGYSSYLTSNRTLEVFVGGATRQTISSTGISVAGGITASGAVTVGGALNFPPITKAALLVLTPTASTAGRWRVTDATPASREAYPDGTNWRYTSDDTIVV